MTTLLIDADYVVYATAAGCQTVHRWEDDIVSTHVDLDSAKQALALMIEGIKEMADEPDADILLCFSCPTRHYFRHDLYPAYKGNRKGVPPLGLPFLREWAQVEWPSRTKPNLEADDVLGILATHPKLIPGDKVIATVDKDLLQIPGAHLNLNDPMSGVNYVSPEEGQLQLWMQALTGDATDNYPGCPGMGPVRAQRLLEKTDPKDYWTATLAAYLKAGHTADDAVVQVNLARILTADSYDFKNKAPILWTPPSASSTSRTSA